MTSVDEKKVAKRAGFQGNVHLALAVVWMLLIIPSIIWWSHSLLWIISASLYANVVSHVGAYQAANAQKTSAENP